MSWSKDEKLDFKKKLEQRTKMFSVSVFKYLDILPNSNSSRIIAFQLGKSASSVEEILKILQSARSKLIARKA